MFEEGEEGVMEGFGGGGEVEGVGWGWGAFGRLDVAEGAGDGGLVCGES